MLSAYFLNEKLTTCSDEFIKSKNIDSFGDKDRTVCQMLRNLNYLNQQKYAPIICSLIQYIHNSVLKLREYKANFDEDWWEDSKKEHSRSNFTEFNKNIVQSKSLLNIDHDVFKALKSIYESEEKHRDLLSEIIFYTYKINIKLCEYEVMFNKNEETFDIYRNYWDSVSKNYNEFIKNNSLTDFLPCDGWPNKDTDCCYYLEKKYNNIKYTEFYAKRQSYALTAINSGNYDCIIEFGAGWGRNLFYFCDKIKEIPLILGEYTPDGINLCNKIKNNHYPTKNIKTIYFDYNNYELFFENMSLIKNYKNVLCLSYWSIEQVTNIKKDFFDNLINLFENVRFIHHEPIGWQIDETKALMKSTDRPTYNKNLWQVLQKLQNESKIKINNTIINYFNFANTQTMGSLLDWESI